MALFIVLLVMTGLIIKANGDEKSTYTTKYDGIDLDEILANDRLLNGYIGCLLETGHCTPDGKELKTNLPDAIENDCKKCTERQREGAEQVMHYIIDHRPEEWHKLEAKYNADGSYKKKYLASRKIETTPNEKVKEENSKPASEETD